MSTFLSQQLIEQLHKNQQGYRAWKFLLEECFNYEFNFSNTELFKLSFSYWVNCDSLHFPECGLFYLNKLCTEWLATFPSYPFDVCRVFRVIFCFIPDIDNLCPLSFLVSLARGLSVLLIFSKHKLIDIPYCFTLFNFINFYCYLYYFLSRACFGFISLLFFSVFEVRTLITDLRIILLGVQGL